MPAFPLSSQLSQNLPVPVLAQSHRNRLSSLMFGSDTPVPQGGVPERDIVVIGAGPGGYASAIRMAQLGLKVAVVEKDKLGGTCLNVGCIPSKALIYVGRLFEKIKKASKLGILVDNPRVDFGVTAKWKDGLVSRLSGGIKMLLKSNGVENVSGTAKFVDQNTVEVTAADGSTQTLKAKNFLIATGSSIRELPIFKYDHKVVIDSTDALNLTEVPKHMVVIGGGVIGLELGMAYAKLGAKVSVVESQPKLLAFLDDDVAEEVNRALKRSKIDVFTGVNPVLQAGEAEATVTVGDTVLTADKVLVAVGRSPNSKGIGLENVGVQTSQWGHINVDNQLRTNVPNIFAIGDVTLGAGLAHRAAHDGMTAARVIAGETDAVLDEQAIPSAIFTDPEIATVGLSEAQAKQKGFEIRIGKFPFAASGKANAMDEALGFVKIIADAKTDKILGVHMVGPEVAELLGEATLALKEGLTAKELAETIHAHPTLPETLQEAAEAVDGKAIHFFTGKKKGLAGG